MNVDPQHLMVYEMSHERTVQNLLWALKEAGVNYDPATTRFIVTIGNVDHHFPDPVAAAQFHRQYVRKLEVQVQQTFPKLIEEFLDHLHKSLLPAIQASRISQWKKEVKEATDEFLFDMRKINPDN